MMLMQKVQHNINDNNVESHAANDEDNDAYNDAVVADGNENDRGVDNDGDMVQVGDENDEVSKECSRIMLLYRTRCSFIMINLTIA